MHISATHSEGLNYYAIFYLAAVLVGIAGAGIAARKNKFSFSEFAVIVSFGILSLLIGSKLILFDISQWEYFFSEGRLPVENGKSVLGAIAGGIIGVWAAGKLFGKRESTLDLFAVSLPLAMAVQRVGCLLAGCCHGNLTSQPWGITYGPDSSLFNEQIQLGLISPDATSTLAVHPDQIYNIIACTLIALLVWKTGARWKSISSKMIFAIILYLGFRFFEEFTRYHFQPVVWMGLNIVQWKILVVLTSLLLLLFYRERKYTSPEKRINANIPRLFPRLRLFLLSIIVLIVTFKIWHWLTGDEQTIMTFIVLPLCGLVICETSLYFILTRQKYVKTIYLLLFAFIFMGQRTDKQTNTPESYTSFNLATALGKFNTEHSFYLGNRNVTVTGTDCDGSPYAYQKKEEIWAEVPYYHSYSVGGIGISRKKYYNQWQSTLTSLNIFVGRERETPFNFVDTAFAPPHFNHTLWSFNPVVQYDGRGIGLGLGASIGTLSYDRPYNLSRRKSYDPKFAIRKTSLQARLRFFSERYLFIETLGGYSAGALGEYNWQILAGSRFNTDRYLLKTGIATQSRYGGRAFVLHGQVPLSKNIYLSPEFVFYSKNGYNVKNGYRAAMGLEYRLYDRKKR